VDQEGRVGRPPGDRPVHVVDGEQGLHGTRASTGTSCLSTLPDAGI
jgi:hypothetical protein